MACIVVLTITVFGFLDWCLCMSRKREPDFYAEQRMIYKRYGVNPLRDEMFVFRKGE